MWAIFNHSAPLPFAHLSFNLKQHKISSSSNLVSRVVVVGRYIRLMQPQILIFLREERLPNHSGKVFIPLKPMICRVSKAVKCWISFGRELSLAHPSSSRYSNVVWECRMRLRLGKTSSSSQYPPITTIFKYFNDPSGRRMMLQRHKIKLVRKHNSPRSGIDLTLSHP